MANVYHVTQKGIAGSSYMATGTLSTDIDISNISLNKIYVDLSIIQDTVGGSGEATGANVLIDSIYKDANNKLAIDYTAFKYIGKAYSLHAEIVIYSAS